MASWKDVVDSEPEFAAAVQALFEARRHKTMATLRRDGSPRISGIECEFHEGEVTFGSMRGAQKVADLHRDPRIAIHSPSIDPPDDPDPTSWSGDAKISGRAVETTADGAPHHSYRVDVLEVVLTKVGGPDHLVIQLWRPDVPLKTLRNYN